MLPREITDYEYYGDRLLLLSWDDLYVIRAVSDRLEIEKIENYKSKLFWSVIDVLKEEPKTREELVRELGKRLPVMKHVLDRVLDELIRYKSVSLVDSKYMLNFDSRIIEETKRLVSEMLSRGEIVTLGKIVRKLIERGYKLDTCYYVEGEPCSHIVWRVINDFVNWRLIRVHNEKVKRRHVRLASLLQAVWDVLEEINALNLSNSLNLYKLVRLIASKLLNTYNEQVLDEYYSMTFGRFSFPTPPKERLILDARLVKKYRQQIRELIREDAEIKELINRLKA